MDEEAGFVAAILANPADDMPGLAFADWLDERGDPRSEFFRLRHLLRVLGSDNRAGTRRRKRELRLRTRAVLREHWAGLRGCLSTRGVLVEGGRFWRHVRLEGAFSAVLEYRDGQSLRIDGQIVPAAVCQVGEVVSLTCQLSEGEQRAWLKTIAIGGWLRLWGFDIVLNGLLVYVEGEFPDHWAEA